MFKSRFVIMALVFVQLLSAAEIEVMFYNVENLFDSKHDEGKNDWEFLPYSTPGKFKYCKQMNNYYYRKKCFETDWTEKRVEAKMSQIKRVLTENRKQLPDFLALAEVENEYIVMKLTDYLGYDDYVVSSGPDKRGIDVAILYKKVAGMEYVGFQQHKVEGKYFEDRPTRNILEAMFKIKNDVDEKYMSLYVNHWPSQGNPSEARVAAANTLLKAIKSSQNTLKNFHYIAVGDFNTIPEDFPHPFNETFAKSSVDILGVHEEFMSDDSISDELKSSMPLGTSFYVRDRVWNLLDRAFISSNLLDGQGIEVKLESYQIYAPDFITRDFTSSKIKKGKNLYRNIPQRYDHTARPDEKDKLGFSDHFPILFKVIL